MSTETEEEKQTNIVRNKGRPDGLFRACMDRIRKSHSIGQALRAASLAAGLLADKNCYAEILSQFYVVTETLEERIEALTAATENDGDDGKSSVTTQNIIHGREKKDNYGVLRKLKNDLGYNFSKGYRKDLEYLLGSPSSDWKTQVEAWETEPAKKYMNLIQNASELELVAAIFILWGPLIIGGGPALKPRVGKAFGEGATHVFEDVVGKGKAERRKKFINAYDTLLDDCPHVSDVKKEDGNDSNDKEDEKEKRKKFEAIVDSAGVFMDLNNEMMMAVREHPGLWSKLTTMASFLTGSILSAMTLRKQEP